MSATSVDVAGPADDEPESTAAVGREPRAWHTQWAARAALVAMLIVGVGAGVYGGDRWRVHQTGLATRAAVDITTATQFSTTPQYAAASPDGNQLWMTMSIHNNGLHPVTVTGFAAADPRVQLGDPGSLYEVVVNANDGVGVSTQVTIDCRADIGGLDTDGPLIAHIRTVDGVSHDVPVPMEGLGMPVEPLAAESGRC